MATYGDIVDLVGSWQSRLDENQVGAGQVVALRGDYTPEACALLLALIDRGTIIVPLTEAAEVHREEFFEIAEVEVVISFDDADGWAMQRRNVSAANALTLRLRELGEPGLVLFSSGSTGKSKAALHNFTPLLEKFKVVRHRMTTLTFLLLDHIGGLNTLLYSFSNGGTIVSVRSRDPDIVCRAIERYRVELLPTSPTFLNLLLISEAYKRYDLSSLTLITYVTEDAQGIPRCPSAADLRSLGAGDSEIKIQGLGLAMGQGGWRGVRHQDRGWHALDSSPVGHAGLPERPQPIRRRRLDEHGRYGRGGRRLYPHPGS
jgi:acyl-coenzyme A synthetase/AMP-(fatty) acid ligase